MKDLEVQDAEGKWWPCLCEKAEEVIAFIRAGKPHRLNPGPCPTCGRVRP